jgi:hypothetical protein
MFWQVSKIHQDSNLVGGLEHFLFFHILGISSSQLTKSYFFRGVAQPPTSNEIPKRYLRIAF